MKRVNEKCTTCGACLKRCPKNAISFQIINNQEVAMIDEKKCINCGKCFKICPNHDKEEKNDVIIKVARIKNKENIIKSTSGGIFGEVARYILSIGGIVYGAALTKDFKKVHHIRCDSIEGLQPIFKSKYVRSDLEDTFKEAEQDLKDDKTVLFSGTPCQIAGLKAYLGKDYENLYTTDILCHGTPSPLIWRSYANYLERREKSKLKKVDFRYFNRFDPRKDFYLEFENGTVINQMFYNDPFGRGFSLGLINNDGCGSCKFNDFRQQSDLTLGDAWGYKNKKYPYKNSLFFINTKKGKELYGIIKDNLIEFDDFDFEDMLSYGYTVLHPTLEHYNYGKVNSNARDMEKELWHWLDDFNGLEKDKKGVGILNFPYENINFGANLVPYSLSKVVEKLGYTPHVIDFDVYQEPETIKKYQSLNFYRFRDKYLNMTPKFKKSEDLKKLDKCYDMFIAGSDQVWRKLITQSNFSSYFLDFAKNKNKISYGASFGTDKFDGDIVDQISAVANIASFYKVSVRENNGVDICKNKLLRDDAEVVLDPTLLLTADDYAEINDDSYDGKVDVAVYLIHDFSNKQFKDRNFKRLFPNKRIVNLKGEYVEKPFGKVFVYNHISKWIDGIRKSKYVVTDSYHGLVFGLIFHKNIICIDTNSNAYSRFATLIENLGGNIDKVLYDSLKDVKSSRSVTNVLDYETIDKNIKRLRKKSIQFLKDNLKPENIKEENESLLEISKEVNKLDEEMYDLKLKREELYETLNSKSWRITEPLRAVKRKTNKIRKNIF